MKEETVLNVLMYLFQYHMSDSCALDSDSEELFERLEAAGFQSTLILQAFDWLETLIQDNVTLIHTPQNHSIRVFTPHEQERIDHKGQGLILTLEQQDILTPEAREIVISQIMALDTEKIDLGLIKWVTLMVLFNQPNQDNALACMEFLVLNNELGGIH